MLFRCIKIFTIALCAFILAIFCLTWLLSPYVIKSQSNDLLSELNYRLSDDSHIRFNPFSFTLSVQDLALQHLESPHVLASIKTGHINVDTFALARNTILFDSILFDGIQLELARTPELLNVAGYVIPLSENTNITDNGSEELPAEDDSDQQKGDDWFVEIATFKLDNFLTDLDDIGQPHQVKLDGIVLNNLLAGLNQQKGHFALKAAINDMKVDTKVNFDLNESLGTAHLEFKLEHLNPGAFAYLAGDAIDALSSDISLSFKQSVTLHEQGISSEVNDLILSVDALDATLQGVNITNDKLVTKIDKLQLNIESVDDKQVITELDAELEVTVDNTRVYPSGSKDLLFAIDRLATKNAALSLHGDLYSNAQPALSLEQIAISNITASKKIDSDIESEKKGEQTPALFSSSELLINTLFAHAGALSVKSIALAPFSSTVWLDESKAMTNLVLPSPVTPDTVNTSQENTTNENKTDTANTADSGGSVDSENNHEQAPFLVQLGEFRITGESSFSIRDRSVSPEFEDVFHIQAFDFGAIDNARPELATPFASEFKTGKYAKASLTGETKLFADKVNLTLASKLTEFSLPKISPYVRTAAGFDLVSGQFDNITTINIVDDEIAGESALMLRGIDLSSADDVKTGDLTAHSFIPLNLALGSLKDGDGNIEMEIPLSGNVNDPDFGLNGFIALIAQKAALAASESYLINTFVPYANVVSLTKMVGSYALKVRIDDLEYQAGQTEIKDVQEAFIGSLVSLLNEKPDLQIKICAMAHSTDIVNRTPDLKNEKDILALKTIANTRGQVFKDYLIEHAQIASARLLLCQAKIDTDMDNKPRIEFEI